MNVATSCPGPGDGRNDEAIHSLEGEATSMCVSCGCGQVNDDHGDQRNITMGDLRSAAQAAGTDVQTVARNIQQGMSQGGGRQQSQMGGQGMGQGSSGQQGMGQGRNPQPGQQPGMRGREIDF
jgi:hypothetical protein